MSETSEGSSRSGPRKWARWALLLLLAGFGAWGVRTLALFAAVRASVKTVQEISDVLPKPQDRGVPPLDGLLFPLWPIGPSAEMRSTPAEAVESNSQEPLDARKRGGAHRKAPRSFSLGPAPQNARASVKQVLHWAEHQIVPRGIARAASDGMPAGIELHGVEALGVGLLSGDRLVTVDGVSVSERSQVVGAVLGARSRRAETMTAGLVRRTKEGPTHFTVIIEQPYPEDVPDP